MEYKSTAQYIQLNPTLHNRLSQAVQHSLGIREEESQYWEQCHWGEQPHHTGDSDG